MAKKKEYTTPEVEIYSSDHNKKDRKKSRNTNHGASVSAKTNAFGLVSIILIIGMIATMFFAVSYSGSTDFKYFSPMTYLSGLSSNDNIISDAWYVVEFEDLGVPGKPNWQENMFNVRPYVVIENQIFYANDIPLEFVLRGVPIVFDIYGENYTSEYINGVHFLHLYNVLIGIGEMPDIKVVSDAWIEVSKTDLDDDMNPRVFKRLLNALSVTGGYLRDSVVYEYRVITRILPWNSVQNGNREWLDNIWIDKENELGLVE